MLKLKTFLGRFSLYSGSIFAGVAGIVLALIGIIIIFTVRVDLTTIVLDWLPKWIVRIIIVINFIMTILISIVLLVGVVKRNLYLMLPWVILGIMLAVGLLISVLYTSINFYIDGNTLSGTLWLVFGLIAVVIYIYMWFVVFSYFDQLKKEDGRGLYTKDPFRRKY